MIILLVLFLFLCSENVNAKVLSIPDQLVKEVNKNYIIQDNEYVLTKKIYYQEEINPSISDSYYLEESVPKDYPIKTQYFLKGKWSSWSTKKLEDLTDLEEETKTVVFYQDLKKVNKIILKDFGNVGLLSLSIAGNTKIYSSLKEVYYPNKEIIIELDDDYYPWELELELTTFVLQENTNASFTITSDIPGYINRKISLNTHGLTKNKIKILECLEKMLLDERILTTTDYVDLPYRKFIKEEKLYRYREVRYKYQKEAKKTSGEQIEKGYKVVDEEIKYYLYREEQIEVYDDIKLNDYVDLDKIVKRSTIPLKEIKISSSNQCGDTLLTISVRDNKFIIPASIECRESPKSEVIYHPKKSFFKIIIAVLVAKIVG